MNAPFDPEQNAPAFVDDVDSVEEFTDSAVEGIAERSAGGSVANGKPLLTDVVDQLQVFDDAPILPVPEAVSPAFTDEVDHLVEFVDQSPEKPVGQ